jgi:hypothetical protein
VVFEELYLNASLPELADFDTSSSILQLNAFMFRPDAVPLKPSGVGRLYFKEDPPPLHTLTEIFNATSVLYLAQPVDGASDFLAKLRSRDWEAMFFGLTNTGFFGFMVIERRDTLAVKIGTLFIFVRRGVETSIYEALTSERQNILLS